MATPLFNHNFSKLTKLLHINQNNNLRYKISNNNNWISTQATQTPSVLSFDSSNQMDIPKTQEFQRFLTPAQAFFFSFFIQNNKTRQPFFFCFPKMFFAAPPKISKDPFSSRYCNLQNGTGKPPASQCRSDLSGCDKLFQR